MAAAEIGEIATNRLLKGWKEIASFFGRDERTVRRWAADMALPVHRVPGRQRAAVYAYSNELDGWLRARQGEPDRLDGSLATEGSSHADASAASDSPPPGPLEETLLPADAKLARTSGRSRRRLSNLGWAAIAAGFLILFAAGSFGGWHLGFIGKQPPSYRPANSAQALYLDGLYNLETRTADGLTRAISLFTQATREDPNYALAYIGLADAYNLISQYTTFPQGDAYPKARAAAERAIALAPNESGGYAALAFNTYYWQDNFPGAMKLFEQAIALAPDNARAHHWYALVAMQDRRFDLAVREISEAQRLDPKAPSILANKGLILFHGGRADDALSILQPLAETNPSLRSAAAYLATIFLTTERNEDFLREFRRSAELGNSAEDLAVVNAAETGYKADGRRGMLSAMLAEQQHLQQDGRMPAFKLALTAAMLGDDRATFDYLALSVRNNEPEIKGIRLEPALLRYRDDRRFGVIVAEAGLSPDNGSEE